VLGSWKAADVAGDPRQAVIRRAALGARGHCSLEAREARRNGHGGIEPVRGRGGAQVPFADG